MDRIEPIMHVFFRYRTFINFTWIGMFVTLSGIALLYLLIDILGVPTVVAGSVGAVTAWIQRWVMFKVFGVVR